MNKFEMKLTSIMRKKHKAVLRIQREEKNKTKKQEAILLCVRNLYRCVNNKKTIPYTNIQRHTLGYRNKRKINLDAIRKKRGTKK
jgi:hypothetical protein